VIEAAARPAGDTAERPVAHLALRYQQGELALQRDQLVVVEKLPGAKAGAVDNE